MDPLHAKVIAAATGSTLTALTMTPFDVVKTRLQTQPSRSSSSAASSSNILPINPNSPPNANACCQPPNSSRPCVRNMSTYALRSASSSVSVVGGREELVCIWRDGKLSQEPVRGFSEAVRTVWRVEGVRGLWKGVGTTFVIGVPSSTAYMLTYDYLLHSFLPPLFPSSNSGSTIIPLTSGILARSLISTLTSPLELVRTNLQATPLHPSTPTSLRSVFASVQSSIQTPGVGVRKTLWRGLGTTLARDVPFSGVYWASYESFKSSLIRRGYKDGGSTAFISGSLSGTLSALLTHPLDVLKTRRQASLALSPSSPHLQTRLSNLAMLQRIIQNEGAQVLFAGVLPRISKIAPACGVMIGCFEGIGKVLTVQAKDLE